MAFGFATQEIPEELQGRYTRTTMLMPSIHVIEDSSNLLPIRVLTLA